MKNHKLFSSTLFSSLLISGALTAFPQQAKAECDFWDRINPLNPNCPITGPERDGEGESCTQSVPSFSFTTRNNLNIPISYSVISRSGSNRNHRLAPGKSQTNYAGAYTGTDSCNTKFLGYPQVVFDTDLAPGFQEGRITINKRGWTYYFRIVGSKISLYPNIPAGYFSYKEGVNYTDGNGTYCAFANPNHYQTFRAAHPAPSPDPSEFISHLTYTGACPIQ